MRAAAAIAASAILFGCNAATPPPDATNDAPSGAPCAATPVRSSLVRTLRFARSPSRGLSDGFDVDAHVSMSGDPIGCGRRDFDSPDGTRHGIDNQVATLVPLIEAALNGNSLDGIIATAVDDGQLMLAIELVGADNLMNDECVTVQTRQMMGTPILDTMGHLDGYQTLDANPMGDMNFITDARIVDGVVDVGPVPLLLPVTILDAHFTLHIRTGFVHIEMHDDGTWSGRLGGGISVAEMTMVAMSLNVPSDFMSTVATLLQNTADLAPDPVTGACTELSATLLFESVPLFVQD